MNKLLNVAKRYTGINVSIKNELVDYYNANCISLVKPSRRYVMKYTDEWCAMFVSVVAHKAGLKVGEFPFEVSVREQWALAKEWGTLLNRLGDVQEGDLIIYDWLGNGGFDHVGLVQSVGGDYIKVIEGNYNNTVNIRTVKRHSKAVKGFISLDGGYVSSDVERIESLVKRVLRGEFGNGSERVAALGKDYYLVQKMINEILG